MKDSPFKLQDKSVLIYGDFNGLSQALIRDFTESGADVGFVNAEKPQTGRFIENINDTREAHASFGRAAQIEIEVKDKTSAFDAVSRMAELFGRIDIVVDMKMASLNYIAPEFNLTQLLLQQVAPFFSSKKKGRIVFVREDESAAALLQNGVLENLKAKFHPWAKALCDNWPAPGFGINTVTVGLNEDMILKKFPQSKSIRASLEEIQKEHPQLKMVDSGEITSVILFLSGAGASGVTGQTIRVARS